MATTIGATEQPNGRPPRKAGLTKELRERIKQAYQTKTVNLVVRYNKLGSQFADFANNVAFLSRCAKMSMVPKSHRVYNQEIRNTRVVVRILDQCCHKIMMADLDHNRKRKFQVRKNRERIEQRLKEIMNAQDFEEVQKICEENKEYHFNDVKEKQRKEFNELMEEYKLNEATRRPDSRRGRGANSSDQGSETGDDRGCRDATSADPQADPQAASTAAPQAASTAAPQAASTAAPKAASTAAPKAAPQAAPKAAPPAAPLAAPTAASPSVAQAPPKAPARGTGKSQAKAQRGAPRAPKESGTEASSVGKDVAEVASTSEK